MKPIMSQTDTTTLIRAFEATDYFVHVGDECHQINIDAPCPTALRYWLTARAQTPNAWLITAHNPQARPLDAVANAMRAVALRACLDAAGHDYAITNSCARDGAWPAEPGVCITNLNEGQARALALRFGQLAIVAVAANRPAQLVWLDSDNGRD